MSIVLITGSGGLIGSESVKFFHEKGFEVVGIDNDMRRYFFGEEASTDWNVNHLKKNYPQYQHFADDIRDEDAMK
ncbi:MAG: NAD-dependent epimerase/dehydratase family protein, partial [Calditrichota bacterium]